MKKESENYFQIAQKRRQTDIIRRNETEKNELNGDRMIKSNKNLSRFLWIETCQTTIEVSSKKI